ncbi:allene oxide cyclase barrel-like domain-containing protein [Allorhizocola rhizosphaerae]|uniref:allene oxide cyclase barrel-like domain-containing protein n=1 Tax=Allorhizocola rhizosphaerae TaxID=1872709 RepID=UPI000E3BC10B|nr:hypothetical protein [Allorhizocola rhizosphaerae]
MTTRRTHLTRFGLAAAAGFTAAATTAAGPAAAGVPRRMQDQIVLSARRKQITLPVLPALGVAYIATFDLFDRSGATVGTAAAGATVVDVTTGGPVVLAHVVLVLADGEIHYQRLMNRFGAYPRTATGPIVGGTGIYACICGEVDITWPDAERIDLVVRPTAGVA